MARVVAYIVRSLNLPEVIEFYRAIGLNTQEEQHGIDPKHHTISPIASSMLLEVYPQTPNQEQDTVVVEVESIEKVLKNIEKIRGVVVIGSIKKAERGRLQIVQEPGGRRVMLLENYKCAQTEAPTTREIVHHQV